MERKQYEMGASVGAFEGRQGYANDLLGFIILFAIIGLVGIVLGVMQDYARDKIVAIGGGMLFLGLAAWQLSLFFGRRKMGIELFQEGFVFRNEKGQELPCRWDEISEVYERVVYRNAARRIGAMWGYTIHKNNGETIKFFNSIEDIYQFGSILKGKVADSLLPFMEEMYHSGKAVSFGSKLGFSRQGVISGQKTLPWNQIDALVFPNDSFEVYQKNNKKLWAYVPHSYIANYSIFKGFLEQTIESMPESERPNIGRKNRSV